MKIPDKILDELETCGLPWRTEQGGKHAKIYLCGRFCSVLQYNGRSNTNRGELNIRAQIRRMAKAIKDEIIKGGQL